MQRWGILQVKSIRYYICGNGRGHYIRSASICKILTDTFNLKVYAYIISSDPNINYDDQYFSNLDIVNPRNPKFLKLTSDIIISDNLISPLWKNRNSSCLLIHIGSFIWTRVSSIDPLFNLLDKRYMEKLFCLNNVHSFVNQYFYDPKLHAPEIRHLHSHGLTDLITSNKVSNLYIAPECSDFIYISLGLSLFAAEEAQQLYTILSNPIFSDKTFFVDNFLWDNITTTHSIYWLKCRTMSHEYCLANAKLLFIRPGLGTLNYILCQKIYTPLVACNFSKNNEITSNLHKMRNLGYNIFDLDINHSARLANFISAPKKMSIIQDLRYEGINEIAYKIKDLMAQAHQ